MWQDRSVYDSEILLHYSLHLSRCGRRDLGQEWDRSRVSKVSSQLPTFTSHALYPKDSAASPNTTTVWRPSVQTHESEAESMDHIQTTAAWTQGWWEIRDRAVYSDKLIETHECKTGIRLTLNSWSSCLSWLLGDKCMPPGLALPFHLARLSLDRKFFQSRTLWLSHCDQSWPHKWPAVGDPDASYEPPLLWDTVETGDIWLFLLEVSVSSQYLVPCNPVNL